MSKTLALKPFRQMSLYPCNSTSPLCSQVHIKTVMILESAVSRVCLSPYPGGEACVFHWTTKLCHPESCTPGRVTLGEQVSREDWDKLWLYHLWAGEEVDVCLVHCPPDVATWFTYNLLRCGGFAILPVTSFWLGTKYHLTRKTLHRYWYKLGLYDLKFMSSCARLSMGGWHWKILHLGKTNWLLSFVQAGQRISIPHSLGKCETISVAGSWLAGVETGQPASKSSRLWIRL